MVGIRGCNGRTSRHGVKRFCAQEAIVWVGGKDYCFYHNPNKPHKFGEGYKKDECDAAAPAAKRR